MKNKIKQCPACGNKKSDTSPNMGKPVRFCLECPFACAVADWNRLSLAVQAAKARMEYNESTAWRGALWQEKEYAVTTKKRANGRPSLEEWMAMPPAKAARIVALRLGLDADRERKLVRIIKSERKRRANAGHQILSEAK